MNLKVDIYELGKILKSIEENYGLEILIKANLSGGWITMNGKALIEKYPDEVQALCNEQKDNIIYLRIHQDKKYSSIIKLTSAKGKKFNINISEGKYKEISKIGLNLNMIKINKNQTKLRIDENIIFTIKASLKQIEKLIHTCVLN